MNWHLTPFTGRTALTHDPFTSSLQREINRVFEDVWSGLPLAGGAATTAAATSLRLDVKEDDKAFQVTADLPGLSEKEVDVTFQDGVLSIRGEKKVERDETKDTWHIVERSFGSFARQLRLPPNVDASKIDAKFEKGVLTVTLPKQPEAQAKAKKIEVKSG